VLKTTMVLKWKSAGPHVGLIFFPTVFVGYHQSLHQYSQFLPTVPYFLGKQQITDEQFL